jgi:hypothetical protein
VTRQFLQVKSFCLKFGSFGAWDVMPEPIRCLNRGSEGRATARKRSYYQRQKGSSGNQQQNPRYAFFWGENGSA